MTRVELTCLEGLADLERMEGPWLESIAEGTPEISAITLRLLLVLITNTGNRLVSAMRAGSPSRRGVVNALSKG